MKLKNLLLKLLVTFFERPRKEAYSHPSYPRILVVSTTGLGDTLWGTPAIRAIKKSFPKAFLSVLTSAIGKTLLEKNPYIDQLYVLGQNSLLSLLKILPKLRRKHFETVLIFHTSQRLILPVCRLIRSAHVIGTEGINKGLDELLTKKCKATYVHEIERRLLIAEEIGVKKNEGLMEIFLTEKEKMQAKKLLKDLDLKEKAPLIGIHPGSKDLFKRWKEKHFIELGRKLVKEKKGKVVITGDHHEKELGQLIANKIPGAHSLAGKISLRILAALLGELHLFITNDTGPMHLAFAMNTPTLALFAPTDPHVCGPYKAKRNVVMYKGLTCFPCLRKKCGEPFCMEQINVDEVWEKIHVLLPS